MKNSPERLRAGGAGRPLPDGVRRGGRHASRLEHRIHFGSATIAAGGPED